MRQLDPQAKAVLERIARANLPPYPQLGAIGARALYRETRGALAAPPPEVESVADLHAPGPAGDITGAAATGRAAPPVRCRRSSTSTAAAG